MTLETELYADMLEAFEADDQEDYELKKRRWERYQQAKEGAECLSR